jgi:RimJ/RimL family protein N-acetyltransferase
VRPPPYRIVTERLVVRCWDPVDAPLLKEAVDSSLEHLRPWMPWARDEPTPLEDKIQLLRMFRGRFDRDEDFTYGVLDREEKRVLGGTGLHARSGDGALEIGYWIRADSTGRGYAREVTAALTRVAFAVSGVVRVEIHVDPRNERSLAVPRSLGFAEEATLRGRLPPLAGGARRDEVVFSLLAEELSGSVAATARLEAFDAARRPLEL